MIREIVFIAHGIPRPKGSKRAVRGRNGQVILKESSGSNLRAWRRVVRDAASRVAPPELFDCPVEVRAEFGFPPPKKWPGGIERAMVARAPDLDKLLRAVLDELTGTIITDDSRVVVIVAAKMYCPVAGVVVRVTPLTTKEKTHAPVS